MACGSGLGVGAGSEADRAEAAASGRGDAAAGGIEGAVVTGLDAISEQGEDVGFVDGGSGKDTSAGGRPGNLGNRQPLRRGERGGRVEPEASAADRLPMLAGGIAAAGQAVGEGEGDGFGQAIGTPLRRAGELEPAPGETAPAFGTLAAVGAPAAEAKFEVGIVAAKSALGEEDGGVGGGLAESTAGALEQHVGEARFERQAGDGVAVARSGGRRR